MAPTSSSPQRAARGMLRKSVIVLGLVIFFFGLAWFAHFSFSIRSYVLSALAMVGGVLVALIGSVHWGDVMFRIRRYFR
jgi:di/tricarboxylate transporter